MPLNNNQKADSAAVRMAKLPVVRSAWSKLSILYTNTKSSHSNLKIICEALENRVVILSSMATDKLSPFIVRLEPQISIANDIACKSLDWLESTFPLLQAPTDEIVAIAKDKMHGAQQVVCGAATETMGCVQHTVEHVMDKVLHTDSQSSPVLERAINAAGVGLDCALTISENLVDQMLPPAEEDEEDAHSVEGFESTRLRTYSVRLLSVSTKLCRRTYKAIETLSRSPGLAKGLQTHLSTFIWSLPQYLQHQAVTVIIFMSQMYNLSCPSPQQNHSEDTHLSTGTETSPAQKDFLQAQLQESLTWRLRLPKTTDCRCKSCEVYIDSACNDESCTSP